MQILCEEIYKCNFEVVRLNSSSLPPCLLTLALVLMMPECAYMLNEFEIWSNQYVHSGGIGKNKNIRMSELQ